MRLDIEGSTSPNEVEFWLMYFGNVLVAAFCVKMASLSEENASYGKVSMACGGGPTGTPHLLW